MRIRSLLIGLISYLVAVCVSAVAVLMLFAFSDAIDSQWGRWSGVLAIDGPMIGIAIYLVGGLGLLPFLIAVAVLRAIGRTGWFAHTAAGIAVSLLAQVLVWFGGVPDIVDFIESWPVTAGGAIAGFTYWAMKTVLGHSLPRVRAA